MKTKDVEVITAVYKCIQRNIPLTDELLSSFSTTVEALNDEINHRKEVYDANAELYRQRSRVWRKNNKERKKEYQKEYMQRDYVKKKANEKKKAKRKEQKRRKESKNEQLSK